MNRTVRLFGFSCAFVFGLSAALQAQITFTWNFEGGTPQQGASSNNAVATAGSAANGTGLSNASYTAPGNGGGQGFTANEWATGGIDLNDYIEFSFSTLSCRTVTITTLNLDANREYNNASNNAPATLSLRSSLNNYATSLGTISTATTNTWASHSITGLSVLVPQNTTIRFRIYGYAAGNTQRYLSFDNVVFTGTFTNTAPSASPMPASATNCVGSTFAFNGTPSGGSGVYSSHVWTVQSAGSTGATNANLSNANTQTVTFNTSGLMAGTAVLRYTVTDNLGCTGTADVTVTLDPIVPPTFTSMPPNLTISCPSGSPLGTMLSYSNGQAGACLISGSVTGTVTGMHNACGGSYTETWTASGNFGTITTSRTITVTAAPLPTMTAPANITVACGAIPASSTLAYTNSQLGGCLISGNSNGSTFTATPGACGGTVTETWTATDVCSRALASVSRTITVSPAALPTMTAPPNITVVCGAIPASSTVAYTNGLGGGCLISGNSNGSTFTATPGVCGGTVTETWTATDACSRALAPVSRTITVSPAALPTMTAPANITVACGAIPASSTLAYTNGLGGGCLLSGNSNGSTFTATPGVCGGTVTETWTATDACSRALAPVSRTITVSPAALPTMTAPANITVACGAIPASSTLAYTNGLAGGCLLSGNSNGSTFSPAPGVCGGTVTETWTATDACGRTIVPVSRTITVSPAPQAAFDPVSNTSVLCTAAPPAGTMLSYDNGQTGDCQIKGSILGVVTGTYSNCSSVFTESWTVTDICGRTSTQSRSISVSAVPLTIVCPDNVIQSGCQTEGQISAAFNAWKNSFSPVGGCGTTATDLSALTPPPPGGSITVTYTASDVCGQVQTCTKTFSVTTCIGISGKIFWEGTRLTTMTGVNGVTVNLSGDDTGSNVTGLPGTYVLSPTMGTNFMITPVKNRPMPHAINGLTAADASRIQKHLLGFLITDVYKLIAADANKSNSITQDDAYLIQNAVLGDPMAQNWFANNTWRFVPKAYVFSNPGNPWGFPEKININVMTDPLGNNDFIGMKLGDVNSSANPVNGPSEQGPELVWKVQDQALQQGETVTATLSANNFNNLSAMQFALQFDPEKLRFEQIETIAGSPFEAENFGLFNVENGEIRVFLSLVQSATLANGAPGFHLRFRALQGNAKLSEVLSLNNAQIPAEAYTGDYAPVKVQLAFEGLSTNAIEPDRLQSRLEQNQPNPFTKSTAIGFYLPEACLAQLRVFDIDGRLVKAQKGWFEKGYHQYTFQSEDFSGDGMLYYELITPFGTQSRKMIRKNE